LQLIERFAEGLDNRHFIYIKMKIKYTLWTLFLVLVIAGCKNNVVNIENPKKGQLKAEIQLVYVAEKKFRLDSSTAPRPQYMQLYTDSAGNRNLTFLNTYNKSIYFYDYHTTGYLKVNSYAQQAIALPSAYLIKSLDSVYIYDRKKNELVLTTRLGQIVKTIPLVTKGDVRNYSWVNSFPQYYPHTATPIIESGRELVFPGQFMTAMPDSLVDKFKFTAHISMDENKVTYTHRYPRALYGNSYNWEEEGLFPTVYYDLSGKRGQIIYSFPVSHDLYLSDLAVENYRTVYGGSNDAGTISSIDRDLKTNHLTPEELLLKVCKTDLYGAVKYDKFRQVYYRFLRKAIPDATTETDWKDKPVSVIVFDKNFKYLGETVIGTLQNCNWENCFVSAEGLNVEYVDPANKNEDVLTLKIFAPRKI
jgi:hypothetical protein